jgi:hypothetical protein
MRNLRHLLSMTAGLGLLAASSVSYALVTDPTVSYGDAHYLGLINDGIPSNPTDEVSYVNKLNDLGINGTLDETGSGGEFYSRVGSTLAGPFDEAVLTGGDKDESESNTVTVNGIFKYLLAKYDAGNAGTWVWYFADGFTGDVTVPLNFTGTQYGVSHMSWYNEGGDNGAPGAAGLGLLGIGLIALGLVKRRRAA